MSSRGFLSIPKTHRRTRSEAKSEAGSPGDPGGVNPAVPRPTESAPDLSISVSASPTSSPPSSREKKSKGRQMNLFSTVPLTPSFRATQTATPFPTNSDLFSNQNAVNPWNPQAQSTPLGPLARHMRANQTGNPSYMTQPNQPSTRSQNLGTSSPPSSP